MLCMKNISNIETLLHNLIRIGQVAEVDLSNAFVRVQCGENLSSWIPMPASVGKNFIAWTPMRIGQTVTLACPSGDLAQARIIGTGYTVDDVPAPSDNADIDLIKFNDGTFIEYDSAAKKMTLSSVGDIDIIAAKNLSLKASQTNIASPVTQTGGDMTSNGISAQKHMHTQNAGDDFGGGADTSPPK